MFDWLVGIIAGLSRGANHGLVVCVALVCVTALAWAPNSSEDGSTTTWSAGTWTVLIIVGALTTLLCLSYLYSQTENTEKESERS